MAQDLLDFFGIFLGKAHRSISPSTMSTDARIAIRSATRCPFVISSITDRLLKEGVRQWTRRGLALPSPASSTPSSPRGDSTALYTDESATVYPSVHSLKWWISASMLSPISERGGGTYLRLSLLIGPRGSLSMACSMILSDSRI